MFSEIPAAGRATHFRLREVHFPEVGSLAPLRALSRPRSPKTAQTSGRESASHATRTHFPRPRSRAKTETSGKTGNVPRRGLSGRFAAAPLYALPRSPPTERSRRHIGWKCVKAGIRECALEWPERPIRRDASLRTSAPTPNRTQQKALLPEVRNGGNPRMRPGAAWKGDSLQLLSTHFRAHPQQSGAEGTSAGSA